MSSLVKSSTQRCNEQRDKLLYLARLRVSLLGSRHLGRGAKLKADSTSQVKVAVFCRMSFALLLGFRPTL